MLMFEYISFQTPSNLMQNMCTLHIQILLRLQYDKIDMNSGSTAVSWSSAVFLVCIVRVLAVKLFEKVLSFMII